MMDLLRYQRSMDYLTSTPTYNDYNYDYELVDTSPVDLLYFFKKLIFLVAISIIGISFFIFILTKKELRNNPTCWLVINIFVAVLLYGSVVLPVNIHTGYITGTWKTGITGCFIFTFLSNMNQIHIQFSILLLMIDRFIYFSKQSNHPEIMTPKNVRIAILSLVACELVLSVILTTVNMPQLLETPYSTFCVSVLSLDAHYSLTIFLPIGVNILFGLISFVYTLVMCHKLNEGNTRERSNKKQAVALNILVGFFNVTCCFPLAVFLGMILTSTGYDGPYLWDIMISLNNTFYLVLPILVMVLIPEIRSEMVCCRNDKKGEKTPLI